MVLDLVNKKVLRADLPGLENVDYEKISQHYRKYYADTIDEFVK